MNEINSIHQKFAVILANTASDCEKIALRSWAQNLLAIRGTEASALRKAKLAIELTMKSKVIWPTIKVIAKQTKKIGWAERSGWQKWAVGGVAVGATVFGGKKAGIADLGTAIGVPLWVVLGGGAAFAKLLVDATLGGTAKVDTATYTVIDAERVDAKRE